MGAQNDPPKKPLCRCVCGAVTHRLRTHFRPVSTRILAGGLGPVGRYPYSGASDGPWLRYSSPSGLTPPSHTLGGYEAKSPLALRLCLLPSQSATRACVGLTPAYAPLRAAYAGCRLRSTNFPTQALVALWFVFGGKVEAQAETSPQTLPECD